MRDRLLSLVVALLALVVTWLGIPGDATAVPSPAAAVTYTYDGHDHATLATYSITQRGPPAAHERDTTYDTDGNLPFGTLSRHDAVTTRAGYDYDHIARFARDAHGSRVTERQAAEASPAARVVERWSVAANAGTKLGWSTGDDIYSLTKAGNNPAWSTVRGRFWKNEASSPKYGSWTDDQLARMRTGRAPQRYNPDKGGMESMDLSHEPIPFRDGGTSVIPRWPQDHAAVDPFRHPGY